MYYFHKPKCDCQRNSICLVNYKQKILSNTVFKFAKDSDTRNLRLNGISGLEAPEQTSD